MAAGLIALFYDTCAQLGSIEKSGRISGGAEPAVYSFEKGGKQEEETNKEEGRKGVLAGSEEKLGAIG